VDEVDGVDEVSSNMCDFTLVGNLIYLIWPITSSANSRRAIFHSKYKKAHFKFRKNEFLKWAFNFNYV